MIWRSWDTGLEARLPRRGWQLSEIRRHLLGENTLVFNFLFIYHNIRIHQRNSYNKKQMFQVVEGITQPLNHRNLGNLPKGATSPSGVASCSLLILLRLLRYRWYMLLTCSSTFLCLPLAVHLLTSLLPASVHQTLSFLPYS